MTQSWVLAISVIVVVVVLSTRACPEGCQCFKDVPTVYCNAPDLDHIPQGIPGNTTLLQMQGTKLAVVRKGDLRDLPLLRTLYLSGNRLQTIEVGVFDDTPALVDLEAGNNKISELSAGVFRGLDKLQEVHLSLNSIAHITAGVFSSRPNLQVVDLQKNKIMSIQSGAFTNLANSDVFDLSNNNIGVIKDGVFQGPQGAKHVMLGNNNISSIDPTAFRAFTSLTLLSLDNNYISAIGSMLHNLENLDVLSAVNNKLTQVSDSDFAGCAKLRMVDLSSNQISAVSQNAFKNLPDLQEIILNKNNLKRMDVFLPPGLKTLHFQQNLFAEIPPLPSGIVDLDMSYNPVESFKEGQFSSLTNIQQLSLSGIKCFSEAGIITPGVFAGLGSVKLGTLSLTNNRLRRVPTDAIDHIGNITDLNLSGNNISTIGPKDFGHHTYLFTLDLSDNKLTWLPAEALMALDIFMLELSGNPLVYIGPDAFKHGLFHVGLENTKLRLIDESAFNSSQGVKSLTLNNNSLNYLPGLIFAPLTFYGDPSEILLLDDNPWRCDCQMRDYSKWLQSASNIQTLTCDTPPRLHGTALRDVPVDQLTCDCPHLSSPNISTAGSTTVVTVGHRAVLKCTVTCCPVAAIIWTTPTGTKLSEDSDAPGISVSDDGALVIATATSAKSGTYTCLAANFMGKDQATVHLTVTGNQ
ncbi:leucine-rich repeat-containing protein 4C-like [Branchiostoma floridae]|uniref:Leucine-rich repeat-containing protein 4C-like n=1 Tax=Branchiostoma floridae TaxID=7739 RepID=A0A9J7NA87_BRAFL|nr:leucine-rich repeat-containing protein 4C-like [Branchiostoma floridae]XP_035698769.1 leucine-rich repeat-containing protein 4C-like [Branchiostoma floridae]